MKILNREDTQWWQYMKYKVFEYIVKLVMNVLVPFISIGYVLISCVFQIVIGSVGSRYVPENAAWLSYSPTVVLDWAAVLNCEWVFLNAGLSYSAYKLWMWMWYK